MWFNLWNCPSYRLMPSMFRSSVVTIKRLITDLMPVYKRMFDGHVVWPAVNEDGPV